MGDYSFHLASVARARKQDLPRALAAANTDVGAQPHDLPKIVATRMGLSHFDDITDPNFVRTQHSGIIA
jgi:hypothetical protein